MPAGYIVPEEEVRRWGEGFGRNPCGTGPFKLVEWRPDEEILLEANPDYFEGPPKLKGIRYRVIPKDLTAVAEFVQGGLDVMGIPWAEFKTFMDDPELRPNIKEQSGLNVYYLGLNCQRPPFDNPKIRQALNYGVDRELILKTLLRGRGILSHGPIPPTLPGHNPALSPYPYDPKKAREILVEEGFGKGISMKIYQRRSAEALSITQAIQSQLKRIGIDVEIVQLEWSAFKEAINKGEADAFYLAWVADYPDPENFLFPLFHSSNFGPGGNRARFKDKEIDQLILKAIATQDQEERTRLYQAIEERIREAAPWIFLWHLKEYVVHQPWVKDFRLYPIYNADKGTEIWILPRR
jgi:peptide/nickel transport system substrate-binding protein/oligopeptide transport system substrate-binding protein